MTVEASIALPLFIFFMVNIMSLIAVIGTGSRINAALHQVGNKISLYSFVYSELSDESCGSSLVGELLTESYVRTEVENYIGEEVIDNSLITGGASGLSLWESEIMAPGDVLDLRVSYKIHPVISLIGYDKFCMQQRYYGKAWTGYDVTGMASDMTDEDPMVYITKSGTVYHVNYGCTYLHPSIEVVNASEIENERNEHGSKYSPCEICGGSKLGGILYICKQGESYHSRINCPGLKRTIYTVPLSKVGGRSRCSKCN